MGFYVIYCAYTICIGAFMDTTVLCARPSLQTLIRVWTTRSSIFDKPLAEQSITTVYVCNAITILHIISTAVYSIYFYYNPLYRL